MFKYNHGIGDLVLKLEQDIKKRSLHPGDRYFIAKEVAKLLGVSPATANRAMRILAERKVLIRTKKSGTFVGPNLTAEHSVDKSGLQSIHIMMAMDYFQTVNFPGNVFVEGIIKVLPRAGVQIHYVPDHNSLSYTKEVLGHLTASALPEGVILIRSTKEVQKYVSDSKITGAVFGSVYPGISNLPSLDVDQERIGILMAEYATGQGYKRFALLMRNEWRRGDNILLNAVTTKLGEAGFGMDALTVCSVPPEKHIIAEEVQDLFSQASERPAILCRGDYYAEVVIFVAQSLGLKMGIDYEVISGSHMRMQLPTAYPSVVPVMTLQEQVEKVVRMLIEKKSGSSLQYEQYIVPVELSLPDSLQKMEQTD